MVHDQGSTNTGSSNWWRYAPDRYGSYLNGTWSRLAPLPTGYAPLYFATGVLADGCVIIEGGLYNNGEATPTTLGASYDPLADQWTLIAAPPAILGKSISGAAAVLSEGTFMVGGDNTPYQAAFNPRAGWAVNGTGKADINDEETWTLLPSGALLTVDANNLSEPTNSEIFVAGYYYNWSSAGSTGVELATMGEGTSAGNQVGPQILRPDGTVFVAGATGHTAVYDSTSQTWRQGPDFPVINGVPYSLSDGPAALLPSGKVLVAASPSLYQPPTHFFTFDGSVLSQVPDPPNAGSLPSYAPYMIVLPTGQVMFNSRIGDVELFTEGGSAAAASVPEIVPPVPQTLTPGQSYVLNGRQLNGVSQGAAYAEGYQPSTNYPLVRLIFPRTQHVYYARTSGHTSMSVTPSLLSSTNFTVPADIETGPALLYAVANGVASAPVSVTVVAPVLLPYLIKRGAGEAGVGGGPVRRP